MDTAQTKPIEPLEVLAAKANFVCGGGPFSDSILSKKKMFYLADNQDTLDFEIVAFDDGLNYNSAGLYRITEQEIEQALKIKIKIELDKIAPVHTGQEVAEALRCYARECEWRKKYGRANCGNLN